MGSARKGEKVIGKMLLDYNSFSVGEIGFLGSSQVEKASGEDEAEKDGKDGEEMIELIEFEMPTSCICTSAHAKPLMDLLPPLAFPGHRGCCFRGGGEARGAHKGP